MKINTVEFYHDVVCGWCYVMSPRLRRLADEFGFEVKHRAFVLQHSRQEMERVFGSMASAKEIILGHLEQCKKADDDSDRIDVKGMRSTDFEYPSGLLGTLACKAAQTQGGHAMHWDIFDLIQDAHLKYNRNIGDKDVLLDLAGQLGLDMQKFREDMYSQESLSQVNKECADARGFNIRTIPALVVDRRFIINSTMPLDEIRNTLMNASAEKVRIIANA